MKQSVQNRRSAKPMAQQWMLSGYEFDVTIVIVNFNTCHMVRRAVQSLLSTRYGCSVELVVVDNNSIDKSVQMLQESFPSVICVANDRNVGHSRGCNQGMEIAKGRYLFMLNSDTIMMAGALDVLVKHLDENPNVGAVAPKVLNVDGSIQGTVKRFPTPFAALFGRFSIFTRLWPGNRLSRRYLMYLDLDEMEDPMAVDSASGAALMVRREVLEVAGPFDEDFFLYWNDVDWCRTIWQSGFEVHYVPKSVLTHEEHHGGSRSGIKQRIKTIVNFHYGAYHYYRKWHVRRFWHPIHFVAIGGLSLRAVLVIATEPLRLFLASSESH